MTARLIPQRVIDRMWDRVDVRGPDECWPWKLSTGKAGYGQVGWSADGRNFMTTAHRVAWMAEHGPLPLSDWPMTRDTLTVDHLCHNPPCCNPAHLRLVPLYENAAAGPKNVAMRARTHCSEGHEFTPENTAVKNRGRICRECRRAYKRRRYAERRMAS